MKVHHLILYLGLLLAGSAGRVAAQKMADIYTGITLKAHKFKAAESIQICVGK